MTKSKFKYDSEEGLQKLLSLIQSDEPFWVIRAQDETAPLVLIAGANKIEEVYYGVKDPHSNPLLHRLVADMRAMADRIADWQSQHSDNVKQPD